MCIRRVLCGAKYTGGVYYDVILAAQDGRVKMSYFSFVVCPSVRGREGRS